MAGDSTCIAPGSTSGPAPRGGPPSPPNVPSYEKRANFKNTQNKNRSKHGTDRYVSTSITSNKYPCVPSIYAVANSALKEFTHCLTKNNHLPEKRTFIVLYWQLNAKYDYPLVEIVSILRRWWQHSTKISPSNK